MSLLPKSRTARRRLMTLAVAGPVLALAVVVALYGAQGSISFFYTPSQAQKAHLPAGQPIQLGGLVRVGSVVKKPDGEVDFVVVDYRSSSPVVFLPTDSPLPDLFKEGQGVVAVGAFDARGVFVARQILAKHDETYKPPELTAALRQQAAMGAGPALGSR